MLASFWQKHRHPSLLLPMAVLCQITKYSLLLILVQTLLHSHLTTPAIIFSRRNHREGTTSKHRPSPPQGQQLGCNIFSGTWVREDTYPLYRSLDCPVIDPEFNCQLYGRPDVDYQKFKWKPTSCDLPRFDGLDFLGRIRGKTVMFVGDSLGRNQWESLICMLTASAPLTNTQFIKADPLSTFKFTEYGVSLSFHRLPYLVDIDVVQGKRVLRLDDISINALPWRSADVLSFNSGHWWTHKGDLQGWDYLKDGSGTYADMDRLLAFQKGMATWANWVDSNIDRSRTRVFFQSISPTHYNPTEWSNPASRNCYAETVPVTGTNYSGVYLDQMKVLEGVVKSMKKPAYVLDITTLSQLRKDAHPSIYSGDLTPEQRARPDRSADCSHWCLPGLPDTWNILFYTALFY